MAYASVGTLGNNQSKASGTTVVITTSATAEAGNLVVVITAWDNTDTADGDTTRLSVDDSAGGNTWTRVREYTDTEAGAAEDGVTGAIFVSRLTNQIASGGTITVTSNTARVAKAASAWEFTTAAAPVVEQTNFAIATGTDPASMSLTSLPARDYLFIHCHAAEQANGVTYTKDANYTALTKIGSTGSASSSNVFVAGGFRIQSTSGTQTVDAATGTDANQHVQILAALYESTATTHNGATASTWTFGSTTAGFATLLGAASASTYTFSSTTVGGARPRAANFEGGTNGNTISTANPGSPHAWDGVTIGADAALIYDNAHARGALAAKVSTGATSTTALLRWVASLAPMTDHYGRVYIYFTAFPAAAIRLVRWQDSAGTGMCGFIQLGTDGKLSVADTSSVSLYGLAVPIALNQWVRIEYRVIHSTTVGQIEVKLFNSPDSTTVTDDVTSAASLNTLADGSEARFGVTANVANVTAFWLDDIRAGDFAYPGPAQESGETASTYTFGATTAGDVTSGATEHFGATASSWTLGVTTAGTRTRFGATASAYTFSATTAGFASHFGTTASAYTFGATTAGVRTRFGATASTWTFSATTAGVRTRFGATASPYVFSATTDGSVELGAGEHSGATASTWTFGATTAGAATHFGSSASTWTFTATTAGTRTRFGATASTYTFGAVTAGVRTRSGATASTWTFSATTAAKLTAKAATASAYVFGATTNGTAGSGIFGATASTWTFGATTAGIRSRSGASASVWTLGVTTAGRRTTFGTAALTGVFTVTTQSTGTAFGSTALPLIFTVTTVGPELVELDAISTGQIGHGIAGRPRHAAVLAGQTAPAGNGHIDKADRGFIAAGIGGEV